MLAQASPSSVVDDISTGDSTEKNGASTVPGSVNAVNTDVPYILDASSPARIRGNNGKHESHEEPVVATSHLNEPPHLEQQGSPRPDSGRHLRSQLTVSPVVATALDSVFADYALKSNEANPATNANSRSMRSDAENFL
eukprot:SAG31_NODE_7859_length_1581_cov_1.811066_3_plen_138_part_01